MSSPPNGFFKFYRGESVAVRWRVDDLPVTADWTVVLTLFGADGTATLTKTPTPDSPSRGYLAVTFTHAQTAALGAGTYRFELHRTDAGAEAMLALGAVEVLGALLP